MNSVKFIRTTNGEVVPTIVGGEANIEGSIMEISDSILKQACQAGFVNNYVQGRRYQNCFYQFGNKTLVSTDVNEYTIIDSYIRDNVWIGYKLKDYSITLSRSNGRIKTSKGTVRITLPMVRRLKWRDPHQKEIGKMEVIDMHQIALPKVLCDYNMGIINDFSDCYDYNAKEPHHIRLCYDNRLQNIMNLTKAEHRAMHNKEGKAGGQSHQVNCKIHDLEELISLMKYI